MAEPFDSETIKQTTDNGDKAHDSNLSIPKSKDPFAMFGLLADIKLSIYVFIFATAISCFSAISFTADLFCQFRVQMAAGLAFMTFLLLLTYKTNKSPKLLAGTVASLALNVVCIAWSTMSNPFQRQLPTDSGTAIKAPVVSASADLPTNQKRLRLLQFNLNFENQDYAKFVAYVLKLKPDVICLEEYSSGWWETMRAVKKDYPYEISKVRGDPFGVAIFSRYPLESPAIVALGKANVPSAFGRVLVNGTLWSILVTHPVPPMNGQWYNLRNGQFKAIANLVKKEKNGHFVVAGDLNCAPWSAHFMNLLTDADLRDTRVGFGIQPSWPVNCWSLRIPIDHVLTTKNIDTKARRIEQDLGSDHLPVYVDLVAN